MQIKISTSPIFGRKLSSEEEAEYSDILNRGKNAVSKSENGKSILVVPTTSLPEKADYCTGVGYLGSKESFDFFEFAKKYWGINEIQLLPTGQFHQYDGKVPLYSGTSMELGNHMINLEKFLSKDEIARIAKQNNEKNKVNFSNIIEKNSAQENAIKKLYNSMPENLKQEFCSYKSIHKERLEPKAIYNALVELNGHDKYFWHDTDKYLYDDRIVKPDIKDKRINEIKSLKTESIDFYQFKQFLADTSLKEAKNELNKKGLKLNGDLICGFSEDERWANPKAFIKDSTIGWGQQALDLDSPEAEKLIRQKVNFYAARFDGIRIDASWTYISHTVNHAFTGEFIHKKDYGDKILNIIDDEVKKVKGCNYDLKNIMHEFAADPKNFNIFDGTQLKPYIRDRVKIYTSDYLSPDWGSNDNYLKRGWNKDYFIIGTTNHDSCAISVSEEQAETLSNILKISKKKLLNLKEFIKAKFAEPMGAKNTMLLFSNALGINKSFGANKNPSENYKIKIAENFEEEYHKALQKGEAFNPMDALEKQFVAQGLDKTEKDLYKKIVKYRKILEQKENSKPWVKIGIISACSFLTIAGGLYMYFKKNKEEVD